MENLSSGKNKLINLSKESSEKQEWLQLSKEDEDRLKQQLIADKEAAKSVQKVGKLSVPTTIAHAVAAIDPILSEYLI